MKLWVLIFASLISAAGLAQADTPAEFAKWANVAGPTSGPTQIYGTYQAGCISGAKALSVQGQGYTVVHQYRHRYYGHPNLLNYIQKISANHFQSSGGKTIVVEDMGYARGGPFFNGHASHQVGLDVDLSLTPITGKLTQTQSDSWLSPTYVNDRKYLLANWGADQARLVPIAAAQPEVNRIFVAPAIKKYFCDTTPKAAWLYKLRAWWGHDDHIHVRLSCPNDSPHCHSQEVLNPNDNGCGGDLGWWFSAEADAEWNKMQTGPSEPRPYPTLPSYCEALVKK